MSGQIPQGVTGQVRMHATVEKLASYARIGERTRGELKSIFLELSSGHAIVLLTVAKLVQVVAEQSIVLIDEPEAHLHPPLLASFTL
ncbi:AAA family ATPase [Streptomyces sp. NPDC046182]|uniref:AAA family ATPase n=1 Tax=Streptomyces sp. NPDC046182 TaxID=3154601 RepID=UPI0033C2FA06